MSTALWLRLSGRLLNSDWARIAKVSPHLLNAHTQELRTGKLEKESKSWWGFPRSPFFASPEVSPASAWLLELTICAVRIGLRLHPTINTWSWNMSQPVPFFLIPCLFLSLFYDPWSLPCPSIHLEAWQPLLIPSLYPFLPPKHPHSPFCLHFLLSISHRCFHFRWKTALSPVSASLTPRYFQHQRN